MKLKNSEIVNFLNINLKQKRLPIKTAFAIKLNADKMQSAATAFNEAVAELRQKHDVEDGKPVSESFAEDFNELLNIDTDINIDVLTMDELEKTEQPDFDSLTLEEVAAISFMVSQ